MQHIVSQEVGENSAASSVLRIEAAKFVSS